MTISIDCEQLSESDMAGAAEVFTPDVDLCGEIAGSSSSLVMHCPHKSPNAAVPRRVNKVKGQKIRLSYGLARIKLVAACCRYSVGMHANSG